MNLAAITLIVLSLCLSVAAQEFDQSKLDAIPKKMKKLIDQNEIAGAVTCVATKDKIVHLQAIGMADVQKGEPMRTDNVFWIASMTKPLTGASILVLQDEGKLSIEDHVSKYIPEFADVKTPSGQTANLTIKQLLTHTSGLADISDPQKAKNLAELIPRMVSKPTEFEPGTKWRYSQSGINTLGRIIEVVSGKSYPDFVQDTFLTPLGMKDTTFYPTPELMKRVATSYKLDPETKKLEPSGISLLSGVDLTSRDRVALPNAGLFSTASDYAKFMQMLLNGGKFEGKTYLKPETVKLMTSNLTGDLKAGFIEPRHGWGCAVGVVLESRGMTAMLSPGTFGHGGAYGTQAWADPVKGIIYILMVQRANFPNSDDSPARLAFQSAAGRQ